jgi:hypothetical protein
MKKFLVLMLVLGLSSLASADVVQSPLIFTVNGLPQPDEIWLTPSEIIELDLELPDGHNIRGFTIDYILSNAQAELITDGASGQYPDIEEPMTDIEFPSDDLFDLKGSTPIVEPQLVRITSGQLFNPPVEGPLVLMRELYVHCLDTTDVILEIVSMGTEIDGITYEQGALLHTLTIHQIPEPVTIALLGLGGLFALRRKK